MMGVIDAGACPKATERPNGTSPVVGKKNVHGVKYLITGSD